jgi:hypothetical protein
MTPRTSLRRSFVAHLPGPDVLPVTGELDRLPQVREVDSKSLDVDRFQRAGLDPSVSLIPGRDRRRTFFQGSRLVFR